VVRATPAATIDDISPDMRIGQAMETKKWSSTMVFLLAAIGSAVGLGNMWKFPYVTGVSGGGAFVFVYFVALAVFITPILIAELAIGRMGRSSSMLSIANVAETEGHTRSWGFVGLLCAIASFLIMTFYTIVAGWSLAYLLRMIRGDLTNATAEISARVFNQLMASPGELALWHGVFTLATLAIALRGLHSGIEKAFKILMPLLFVLLLGLVIYGLTLSSAGESIRFLFSPDFAKIDSGIVLAAIGQAFFSIGVATGVMITFGAYLPANTSITRAAIIIVLADTFVALVAGLAIFPIVFQYNLDPAEGAGLMFVSLPVAFAQMAGGVWIGIAFFLMFTVAAITSLIGAMEAILVLVEKGLGWRRLKTGWIAASASWIIGLASVLSLNLWADFKPVGGRTLFGILDYVSANVMLPVGGMLVAVFVGWRVSVARTKEELGLSGWLYTAWLICLRFLAPIAIFFVMLSNLGWV
jgi:neurotransmitter:Na+ symporter, NSS family